MDLMMKTGFYTAAALLIALVLGSCSATNRLTIGVTEPAPVYLPSEAQAIGIIDRSLPSEKSEISLDILDKILSAEGKELDQEGAQSAILGLQDALLAQGRFQVVRRIDAEGLGSPGLSVFPAALPWKNGVDAIYALSFYDTDTKVDYQVVPIEVVGPLGVRVPAV
jgi:hypothetical protein